MNGFKEQFTLITTHKIYKKYLMDILQKESTEEYEIIYSYGFNEG